MRGFLILTPLMQMLVVFFIHSAYYCSLLCIAGMFVSIYIFSVELFFTVAF